MALPLCGEKVFPELERIPVASVVFSVRGATSVVKFETSTLAAIASEQDRHRDPRTSPIIAAAIEVHRHLGPGLLESAYEECLCHELHLMGLDFKREVPLPVIYKGLPLDCGYQIDLIVREEIVVELKAIERILPIHQAQLLTYLKLADKHVGLLINFNVPVLTQGITRRVR